MNNKYLQVAVIIVLLGLAFFVIKKKPAPQVVVTDFASCVAAQGGFANEIYPRTCNYGGKVYTEQVITQPDVIVDTPQPNTIITSPLTVSGRAMNNWYFEANLPVTLKDANGNVLAQKGFYGLSDWTIPGYVGFNDTLTFSKPATQDGLLIIEKDNPSGDPINDKSFVVPVKFY